MTTALGPGRCAASSRTSSKTLWLRVCSNSASLPDTSVYVAVEDELLKLSSQAEYEETNAPVKKGRKKAKDEDREPELSGAAASGENTKE